MGKKRLRIILGKFSAAIINVILVIGIVTIFVLFALTATILNLGSSYSHLYESFSMKSFNFCDYNNCIS